MSTIDRKVLLLINSLFMNNNTDALQDIRDIFSILHDGETAAWRGNEDFLTLSVECEYLASTINKSYTHFYVEFEMIGKLEFYPWRNASLPQIVFTKIDDIFKAPLMILSADIENDIVKITCNAQGNIYDYWGGFLLLNCESIKVFDEGKQQLTIDEFDAVSNNFWDEVSKQTEAYVLKQWEENDRKKRNDKR